MNNQVASYNTPQICIHSNDFRTVHRSLILLCGHTTTAKHGPLGDPYMILGVPVDATDKQIKSAYRQLSLKSHPDRVSEA
jgi:DnaJ-class molecular chaperone